MPEKQGLGTVTATSGHSANKFCPLKAQASVRFGSRGWEAFPQAQPTETAVFWDSLSDPRLAAEVLLHFSSVLEETRSALGPTDRLYIRLDCFVDFEDRVNELKPFFRKLVSKALAHRGHLKPWKVEHRTFHLAVVLEAASVIQIPKRTSSPSTPREESGPPGPLTADAAIAEMDAADEALTPEETIIVQTVQAKLNLLVGRSFGSLDENQRVTDRINQLLQDHHVRVACIKVVKDGHECGEPSILRCYPATGQTQGAFHLEHARNFKRHLGASVIPPLRVVPYTKTPQFPTSRSPRQPKSAN